MESPFKDQSKQTPKSRKAMNDYKYRLRLLDDDIQVANKTKENLKNSNQLLSEQIEEEQFKLEELRAKRYETIDEDNQQYSKSQISDENSEQKQEQESTFFGNLANLESLEASLKAQIEQIKKQKKNLAHEYGIQIQRRRQLRSQIEATNEKIIIQRDQNARFNSDLAVAEQKFVEQDEQLAELKESHFNVQQEYQSKLEELKLFGDTIKTQLEDDKKSLLKDINKITIELDGLNKDLETMKEAAEKQRKITAREYDQKTSINSWLAVRSILLDKMKKKRIQQDKEQNSLIREQQALEEINRQFKALFGDDDPGDGTGDLAKAMVQAEKDSLPPAKKKDDIDTPDSLELSIEREYKEQLPLTLKQLDDSLAIFKKHKDDVFLSLDEEIEECQQDGFLALLQSEKDELMVNYTKY